jgi:hypothetical protein
MATTPKALVKRAFLVLAGTLWPAFLAFGVIDMAHHAAAMRKEASRF